ncbi:S8 family serine peptidase, partial [Hydrogenophaga sp.]|uniref:S8 family serine peptidase n=1 Tax=Hydrogenophaga sp. TaxID=1904254 RepID=UPI0026265812
GASPPTPGWMSTEVGDAWTKGYKGQGVTITVVDDFRSASLLNGKLGTASQRLRHGQWTAMEAGMIAPLASVATQDFTSGTAVKLSKGLNVLNLSYGMMAAAGYSASQIRWSAQENSIITYAKNGTAVISKAAGNDGIAVLGRNARGQTDYLNLALKGAPTAIYVGALNTNGTKAAPATLASYSNTAGTDTAVQKQFLVVGVEGAQTGLYGTSFAAPVITGYAAVLGSKFTKATPVQITNQLLNTARQDTIKGYKVQLHGRGEASLTRALAPVTIR